MADLNLTVIKKQHADDIDAYKHTKASPQHLQRHWLLMHIDKMMPYMGHGPDCTRALSLPRGDRDPCSCGLDKLLEKT